MLTPQSKGAGQLSFFIKYIYLLLKVCLFGRQTLVVVLKPRKKIHKGKCNRNTSSLTVQETAPSGNLDMSFFLLLVCLLY